jgi:hypothetical protein
MSNVVARVQRILEAAGFARSTIALAAVKDGDYEIMEMLLDEFGQSIFDDSAYAYAAAGNRPDVMRWICEKGVLPELDEHVDWAGEMRQPKNKRVNCGLAFVAAENGAFEALEYIAEKIPAVRLHPLRSFPMSAAIPGDHSRSASTQKVQLTSSESYNDKTLTYAGLLVVCALVARAKGRDTAQIEKRLGEQLADGAPAVWRDLDMALRFEQFDLARLLLEAGAKINLSEFLKRMTGYGDAASALSCVSEYLEETGKRFAEGCEPYVKSGGYGEQDVPYYSVDEMIAADEGFRHYVHAAVELVAELTKDKYGDQPKVADGAALSGEMARFMGNLDVHFAGPAMLVNAVSQYVPSLVKVLLEKGVDPNEYQPMKAAQQDPSVIHIGKRYERRLAVHEAGDQTLRLLVSHGADINLPMYGTDQNLLYILCTTKDVDTTLLYTFAECGGDFAVKFDGKTAASYAKKQGEEFYGHFMAAKAHISVLKGLGDQPDGKPKKGSRPSGPEAL